MSRHTRRVIARITENPEEQGTNILEDVTMAVKVRLRRVGTKKAPLYRVVVA